MKENVPKLLFKYRALKTKTDLIRLVDILVSHRLFFPAREYLNDPFEVGRTHIFYGGYAGSSMYLHYEQEEPMINAARNEFHVLSLSANCFSPQLWAYYTESYTGVCLCYSTENSFNTARAIQYYSERPKALHFSSFIDNIEFREDDFQSLVEKTIEEDIFSKQKEWEHESEWRIARRNCGNYFDYESNELLGIIIGHNMDQETRNFLLKFIPTTVKVLVTYPQLVSSNLGLLEYGTEVNWDETTSPIINTCDKLYESLLLR